MSRFPRGERPRHNGTVRVRQTGESDGRTFSCGRSTIHRQSVNIYLHTFLAHFSDTIVLPPLSRMWRKGPVTCFYIFMIGGHAPLQHCCFSKTREVRDTSSLSPIYSALRFIYLLSSNENYLEQLDGFSRRVLRRRPVLNLISWNRWKQ